MKTFACCFCYVFVFGGQIRILEKPLLENRKIPCSVWFHTAHSSYKKIKIYYVEIVCVTAIVYNSRV